MQSVSRQLPFIKRLKLAQAATTTNLKCNTKFLPQITSRKRTTSDNPLIDEPVKRALVGPKNLFNNFKRNMNKQAKEMEDNIIKINSDIKKARVIKNWVMKKYEQEKHDFVNNKLEKDAIAEIFQSSSRHFSYDLDKNNIAYVVDDEEKTIITSVDKQDLTKENYRVTFYKKDPEITYKYESPEAEATEFTDKTVETRINNIKYKYCSKPNESTLDTHYNLNNGKEINIENKVFKGSKKQLYRCYTETTHNYSKGIFITDKFDINKYNYKGTIAFVPQSFQI